MFPQRPVQVQHLLHGRVKARQQHVNNHQHLRFALRVDKGAGDLLLVQVPGHVEFGAVVGTCRDDGIGAQSEVVQALSIPQRGGSAWGNDLRLETGWANALLEMLGDI